MRKRYLFLPILAAFACNRPASDSATTPTDDSAARGQIEQLRQAWLDAAATDSAATVAALYTDDAVFVGTEQAPVRGRAAIQQAFAQSFPLSSIDNIESKELVVSGDLAYDYGEYRQTVTPPGAAAQTTSGHYLVVLRRQSDGSWKLAKHISTTPPVGQ